MTTYDVIISGIQEKHQGNAAQIKQDLATFLQISTEKAEQLINSPSGKPIYQNVSGAEAEQHQRDLNALGVICVYMPGSDTITLSLVDKEDDEDEDVLHCPSCDHEIATEEGQQVPDKCPKCGASRQRFLDIQTLEIEKEDIRKRLLQTESAKNLRDKKNQQELEDAKRKKQLEAEIKKELDIKKDRKPLIYASGAILCGALIVGVFNYFYSSDELSTAQTFDDSDTINTEQISGQSAQQSGAPTTEQSLNPPLSSQQSLQQAHDQSTKVLSAFGLNADAFAGSSSSTAIAGSSSSTALAGSSSSTTLGDVDALTSGSYQNIPATASTFLLDKDTNNQLWDLFLAKEIKEKIDQSKEQTAYQLSRYLINSKSHMKMLGTLLTTTQQKQIKNQIYSDIEEIINLYPVNEQIQLLSQAGIQQYTADKSLSYIARANILTESLSNPDKQLDAALQIGVAYFKIGDTAKANQYFGKINDLLSHVSATDKKILSRIAIAKAYKEANSDEYANQWLASAIKLTPLASNKGLNDIVTGTAYLDQLDKTLEIIAQAPSEAIQDELLLSAIQVFVETRSYNHALKLISQLESPYYKASSEILIASHAQRFSHQLAFTENFVNREINAPLDKAILLSQLALQNSILANHQKTSMLFQSVKQHLNSVPISAEKDKALDIISSNFTRTLNTKYTSDLQASIQSPAIKSNLEAEVAKSLRVASLIN